MYATILLIVLVTFAVWAAVLLTREIIGWRREGGTFTDGLTGYAGHRIERDRR